jgi:hypothetical protein
MFDLGVLLLSFAAAGAAVAAPFFSERLVKREASSQKKRLEAEVGVTPAADRDKQTDSHVTSPGNEPAENIAADPQFRLLLDYYSQSLAQFKASFRISLFFASLGAFILLSGVALAVFRAGGNGSQYAAVTSTVAGTVASLLSGILFVYSSRAIKHLDSQTMRLREDRDRERSFERNCMLLDRIESDALRDQVTANIIIGRSLESVKNADRSAKGSVSSRKSARSTHNGKTDVQSVRQTTATKPTSQPVSAPDPDDSI